MASKRNEALNTSKRNEKALGSTYTIRTRVDNGGMRRFRSQQHKERFENVISKWKFWLERQVILEDFVGFELAYLIHQAGWERVIAKPHTIYPTLVQEFLANFNMEIESPGSEHEYQT